VHAEQSYGQFSWVSPGSQTVFPHGQSDGQSPTYSSVAEQMPSPQNGAGQSWGQVSLVSLPLHVPSPHLEMAGQSLAHVVCVSPKVQKPSPHAASQSAGQVAAFSFS